MRNHKIIQALQEISACKQLLAGNPYEAAAYERAFRELEGAPELTSKNFPRIRPGMKIGKSIAAKIQEFLDSGKIQELVELRKDPRVMAASKFSGILGVGPASIAAWTSAGYYSPEAVLRAGKQGYLKLTKAQAAGLIYRRDLAERIPRKEVEVLAGWIAHAAMGMAATGTSSGSSSKTFTKTANTSTNASSKTINTSSKTITTSTKTINTSMAAKKSTAPKMYLAGSYRRGAKSSGDVDLVILLKERSEARGYLAGLVRELQPVAVLAQGSARAQILLRGPTGKVRQVDLMISVPKELATMMSYLTGPAEHNEKLRALAKKRGMTLNQHGLYRGNRRIPTPTESSIYEALGVKAVEPSRRG